MTDIQTAQAASLQGERPLEDGLRAHIELQRMMEEEVGSREERKFLPFLRAVRLLASIVFASASSHYLR